MRERRFVFGWILTALLAVGLVLAACETDDEDETPTPAAGETGTPAGEETPSGTPAETGTPSGAATGTPVAGEAQYGLAPQGSPTPGPTEAAAGEQAAGQALQANIGQEAPQDLIDEWNIDITPDGEGLPEGEGSVSDGAEVYSQNCARCHGADGEGTDLAPLLVLGEEGEPGPWEYGAPRTVANYWPYLTTYIDYIRRAMPFDDPTAISDEEVYAVTAWILNQNGMLEDDAALDADTVMQMNELPNFESFFSCYPDACRPESELTGQ